MKQVKLIIPSASYHIGQIITGFLMLRDQGWNVEIADRSKDRDDPFFGLPVALAEYRGMTLFYDLWDGYQNPEGMEKGLKSSDLYFKRSFDEKRNAALFPEDWKKMRTLGLYYRVTHRDSPILEPLWRDGIKRLMGRAPERYFTPEVFEEEPKKSSGPAKILFLTQLWDTDDPSISREDNRERERINEGRIQVIRALRQRFGECFLGGLNDTNSRLSQTLAPDLIVDRRLTERRRYLQAVHDCDICIGTMGLYESIGGKTGEYVAAGKAIVNERLHFDPGGGFSEGVHYLSFDTLEQCVQAVEVLAADPEKRYEMRLANHRYYQRYLRPDRLVLRTLEQADILEEEIAN